MRKKEVILVITTMLLLQSLIVTIAQASPGPDYDLMIITPEDFKDELEPLRDFKIATGRTSIIVTIEDIYANPLYNGDDEAEEIKKCIADYEDDHNVKYVLLVGDVDKIPMRYFYLKRLVSTEVRWLQYYLTDHYYADLYSGGSFCTWDANGNGIYGEMIDDDDDGDYTNVDGMDHEFDVIVGRIPVNSGVEVTRYVNKVISYETDVDNDPWFKNILLVTGTGDWVYPSLPTTYDTDQNDLIATEMATAGFSNVKLYHSNPAGPTYPNSVNINNNLNSGAGFINVISHGCETSWGVYTVPGDMTGLTNSDKLTVVYSFGCSTAKVGPIAAADPYIGISGSYKDYGTDYQGAYWPCPIGSWVEPEEPDCLQDSSTDFDCMPEYWNFHSDKGAVAFVGSTAETSGIMGGPVMQYFFESYATDGERVLGDLWNSVSGKVLSGGHSIGSDWDRTRRWLYINVFGDPTLHLGGLPDKPPETSISLDTTTPYHISGSTTYVTSSTDFTLSATDDGGPVVSHHYRYYQPGFTKPSFSIGSSISIAGLDGEYIIEYYSTDTGGNTDYPFGSKLVILDNSKPDTTISIGTPKHIDVLDTYISSDTEIYLSASDDWSGVDETYYRIWGVGGWQTYSGAFYIPDSLSDGFYTVDFYSVDNLGNAEDTKSQNIILDNTPPIITYIVGTPKHTDGDGLLWVKSTTPITINTYDAGAGIDPSSIRYTLDSKFGVDTYTYSGPFTLPYDPNENAVEYQIEIEAKDYLSNKEELDFTAWLDDKAPSSGLNIGDPHYYNPGDPIYITSGTPFWFEPHDYEESTGGVGVEYTYYRIDGTDPEPYILYTPPGFEFSITGDDGLHHIDYYSIDYLGNMEDVWWDSIYYLDNTPPEINIELPEDGAYVFGEILIEISATDEGSGVDYVEYSLDGGATWLPASYNLEKDRWLGVWDTTTASEGTHTILTRATDHVDNTGYDESPTSVNVMYLEYEIDFSDSDWNDIIDFNVVFNQQKTGKYKINTNPGSIYEIITITNTGTVVTLPELILDVMIPIETDFLGAGFEAFMLQGAKSIHVYLNGVDVTPSGKWQPNLGNIDVMQALAPGDTIQIYVHYEYSWKGGQYEDPEVSAWTGEDYKFETDILSAYGPSWVDILTAIPDIVE
jgi:hypothetical protein